jgi:hypothetical protein
LAPLQPPQRLPPSAANNDAATAPAGTQANVNAPDSNDNSSGLGTAPTIAVSAVAGLFGLLVSFTAVFIPPSAKSRELDDALILALRICPCYKRAVICYITMTFHHNTSIQQCNTLLQALFCCWKFTCGKKKDTSSQEYAMEV